MVEYIVVAEAGQAMVCMSKLLPELELQPFKPTEMNVDEPLDIEKAKKELNGEEKVYRYQITPLERSPMQWNHTYESYTFRVYYYRITN